MVCLGFNAGLVLPLSKGLYGSRIALSRSATVCRRCVVRATVTPPRRTAALSTLAATSVLSAATGGPSLAAWAAVFGCVGLLTEAPVALIGVAAGICAGIADLLALDIGRSPFDTGALPFVLFAVGSAVAGVVELSDGPPQKPVIGEEKRSIEIDQTSETEKPEDHELGAWDRELKKRDLAGGD